MTAHELASVGTLATVVLLIFAGVGVPWAMFLDRRDAAEKARQEKQSKGDNQK